VPAPLQALVFELDDGRYAVSLASVAEIVRAVAVVPLPGAPPLVEGIVDVHGEVAAVVDLRRAFGLPPRPPLALDHFVVVRTPARLLVLRVDRVTGVTAVETPDRVPAAVATASLEGSVRLADGLVLVHDADRLVSAAEGATLDRLLQGRRSE
jgi:purine-binding chemotaxis protein CheW